MMEERSPRSGLAEEIQQGRPFSSPEAEAYLNLLRTASIFRGRAQALLRSHGISQPQYNVLRILRGAGEDGLRCGQIAKRMITRVPDISRLLDRIHDAGWTRRRRSDEDRRVVLTVLSEAGSELLARLDQPLDELIRGLFSGLTREEVDELSRLLVSARS